MAAHYALYTAACRHQVDGPLPPADFRVAASIFKLLLPIATSPIVHASHRHQSSVLRNDMTSVYHRDSKELIADIAADTLAGADLTRAVLAYADLNGVDARGANLRHADLCNADLRGARFDGATITGGDATLSDSAGAFFTGARLDDARFQGMNKRHRGVVGIDFAGADMTRVTLKNSNLNGSTFTNAILRRADLTRCNLAGADLSGAELTDACLASANLSGARLRYASLVGVVLTGANLEGASLEGADLTLANLSGVRVAGADFSDTLWSKTTMARATGLDSALGLDRLRFGDPSAIDIHTLRTSIGCLRDDLLEQCGLAAADIVALRQLFA